MDAALRALVIYLFLMLLSRITGKRALSQTTPFDLVLLLIFSEALQGALTGEDETITSAMTVILTLVVVNIIVSEVRERWHRVERVLEGVPIVIMEDGKPLMDRMGKARVDLGDVLEAAREMQSIDRLDQIRLAVLERSGRISIMPK